MQKCMKPLRENHHFYPYWKILSHQEFFRNFSFPDYDPDRFAGKLVQQKFMSTFSVFVKYRVMTEMDTNKVLIDGFSSNTV